MSDIWDLTPEEALAEHLVDQALATMAIPPDLLPEIRVTLIGNLLHTPQGRARLRRAAGDPVVLESGEVLKSAAQQIRDGNPKKRAVRGGKK